MSFKIEKDFEYSGKKPCFLHMNRPDKSGHYQTKADREVEFRGDLGNLEEIWRVA
jgi:hypothetical protein